MLLWKRFTEVTITKALRMAFGSKIQLVSQAGVVTEIDLTELAAINSIAAADLAKIDGITNGTGAAGKAVVLDAQGGASIPGVLALEGNTLEVEGGAGVVGDAETYATSVERVGGIIVTRILIDLTGLDSSGTADDIIGDLAGGAAHIGQITEERNGTIVGGTIRCLEIPTGGDPDVDFYAADEATGAFDDAVGATLTETKLINTGDWTLEEDTLTALPAADQYLYMVAGATDDATYTAGKFLVTLYGVPAA